MTELGTRMLNLCFALTAGGVLTLSGFGGVICVSANGHIRVEPICQPCDCGSAEGCKRVLADDADGGHPDCHNCSDVPVSELALSRRPSWRSAVHARAAELSLSASPGGLVGIPNRSTAPSAPPVHSPPIYSAASLSISTVVLRC